MLPIEERVVKCILYSISPIYRVKVATKKGVKNLKKNGYIVFEWPLIPILIMGGIEIW